MDLRQYFRRIREIESNMPDAHVFVTSLETPDGGKAGVVTEVPREIAARMITEGRALLATKAEKEEYLEKQKTARVAAQRAEIAQRLQVTVVADDPSRPVPASENATRPGVKK